MTNDEPSAGNTLFGPPCRFVLSAVSPEHFPSSLLPEVAFIGRSNAGKSSLINALARQKGLARTSNTPGRTQQIVFFNAADRLLIADLPGYGHAKAPKDVVHAWNRLIHYYLKYRNNLRCVVVLVDSRHGLLKNDHAMLSQLDAAAISTQVVLAKADYLKPEELAGRQEEVAVALKKHPASRPDVLCVSSKNNIGLDALRDWLAAFASSLRSVPCEFGRRERI